DEAEGTEYLRTDLTNSLIHALYKLGKWKDAYQTADDKKEYFASLTRFAILDDNWDDVRSLLENHRKQEPDDPYLYYVSGRVAANDKQWDEAVRHFRAGAASDEASKWQYHHALIDAYVESGRWRELFETSS